MSAEFHIRTNGLYWRPEAKGYTEDPRDAGRWSEEEAHRLIEGLGPEKHAGIVRAEPREPAPVGPIDLATWEEPITEDWLKACGFKWHRLERQTSKHWLLWIGTAAREEGFLRSYEDLGVEVAQGGRDGTDDWWFCWLRDDAAGTYHRFIHIRHLRTRGDLCGLIEGLIGYTFDPANAPYGTLLKPEHAERVREEYERLDRKMNRERPKWSTIEEDDSRGRPLPEHLEAYDGEPK